MPSKSARIAKRSRKGARKANKVRKAPRVKSAFGAKVRSVVTRMAEKKRANYTESIFIGSALGTNFYTIQNKFMTGTTTGLNIGQGTGQGDRIGDKIRVKKLLFRASFFPTPYNVSTNPLPEPQMVRLWFFSQKNSNAPITSLSTFFQNGNTSSAPSGTILDLCKNVNSDNYTYYTHRDIKMGFAAFVGTPGGQVAAGYTSNNDFELCHKETIDLTPYVPKIWSFNDSGNTCTSRALFMMVETMSYDGQTQAASELPIGMFWTLDLSFTDM